MDRNIGRVDSEMAGIIGREEARQATTLMMIASENHPSKAAEAAVGSVLGSKYSEGYPGRRFYQGQELADETERLTQARAQVLFGVPYVNVQPYSGSPANMEVYAALLELGDTIMGLSLDAGGHLTHGAAASRTSRFFRSVQYGVSPGGYIDYDEMDRLAQEERPKIIVAGTTAYARVLDWERFADIAERSGAILMADISHVAGLIVGDAYPSPVPYVDVVTTTTHKTLRGPRGAMIMVTEKGLQRDNKMGNKIDSAVFPGMQGGPHMNSIAGIGIALKEAASPQFKEYARNTVANARTLAATLIDCGFDIVTGGTDSHLVLVDLRNKGIPGKTAAEGLEKAGIVLNMNAIPHDPKPAFYPSGLRIGTAALTSRGMGEFTMKQVANIISLVVTDMAAAKTVLFGDSYDETKLRNRRLVIENTRSIAQAHSIVGDMCRLYPIKETYLD